MSVSPVTRKTSSTSANRATSPATVSASAVSTLSAMRATTWSSPQTFVNALSTARLTGGLDDVDFCMFLPDVTPLPWTRECPLCVERYAAGADSNSSCRSLMT